MVAEVTALLAELGVERPHMAGNSLGGRLALEAAAAGHAASATALSPAGFWTGRGEYAYSRAVLLAMQSVAGFLRPVAPTLARSTAGRALAYGVMVTRPSRVTPEQALGDMAAFDAAADAVRAVVAQLTPFTAELPAGVPVLVAWGTRDRLLAPRQVLSAKAKLPGALIRPLPGCGHVPMTDDPALVADVLLQGSGGSSAA
jgi:pimeloyl-ACP methyl ester carboxylesterase